MFYVKTEYEGIPIQVTIYGDDIYTKCFNCGVEMEVDDDTLREVMKNGDLSSTRLACCENKKPKLTLVK